MSSNSGRRRIFRGSIDPKLRWVYVKQDLTTGEVDTEELKELFRANKIHANTLVWTTDMSNWMRLSETAVYDDIKSTGGVIKSTGGDQGTGGDKSTGGVTTIAKGLMEGLKKNVMGELDPHEERILEILEEFRVYGEIKLEEKEHKAGVIRVLVFIGDPTNPLGLLTKKELGVLLSVEVSAMGSRISVQTFGPTGKGSTGELFKDGKTQDFRLVNMDTSFVKHFSERSLELLWEQALSLLRDPKMAKASTEGFHRNILGVEVPMLGSEVIHTFMVPGNIPDFSAGLEQLKELGGSEKGSDEGT